VHVEDDTADSLGRGCVKKSSADANPSTRNPSDFRSRLSALRTEESSIDHVHDRASVHHEVPSLEVDWLALN